MWAMIKSFLTIGMNLEICSCGSLGKKGQVDNMAMATKGGMHVGFSKSDEILKFSRLNGVDFFTMPKLVTVRWRHQDKSH